MVAGLMQLFKPLAYSLCCMMSKVKGRRGPQPHRDLNGRVESSILLFSVSLTGGISRPLLPPAGRKHELHNRGRRFTAKLMLSSSTLKKWLDATSKTSWTKHLRQMNSKIPSGKHFIYCLNFLGNKLPQLLSHLRFGSVFFFRTTCSVISEQTNRLVHKTWFRFLLAEKKSDAVYRRRPRRPPFLLVESDGIGVTSSEPKKRKNTLPRDYKVPATNGIGLTSLDTTLQHLQIWCCWLHV